MSSTHNTSFLSHRGPATFPFTAIAAALALTFGAQTASAAELVITSRDPAGVGFNDPTPVAPVGGNTGTTLGQQRLNVYKYVAGIWGRQLTSTVPIQVSAGWEALSCDDSSAVLGSAGAWNIWHDFPGSIPHTWYPQALANKLSGVNLTAGDPDDGSGYGNVDIKTQFNVNLGNAGCLTGTPFYLGLDGNAAGKVDFVETLLHELGHGLGFSVLTVQVSTGFRVQPDGSDYTSHADGVPSIWERFMFDNTTGKTWLAMSNNERKASAVNPLGLAWIGSNAVAAAAATLGGTSVMSVATSVPNASGRYDYGLAEFGPAIATPSALGTLANSATIGCEAYAPGTFAGKVALISRGTCTFVTKAKNAQNAGAVGVVIANNVAGSPPAMGGTDPSIRIPTISVTLDAGNSLRAAIAAAPNYGSRAKPGSVSASLFVDSSRRAGADSAGRPLLYTPGALAPGSSVSHWDSTAFPNLLMEPSINADLTTSLVPPHDLTFPLLKDLGW